MSRAERRECAKNHKTWDRKTLPDGSVMCECGVTIAAAPIDTRPGGWIDGTGWMARRCDLPFNTVYRQAGGKYDWLATRENVATWTHDVIVRCWPDGTRPSPGGES